MWIDPRDKIKSPEEVDNFISAELPDRASDPEAYRVVADMMMHGPCGNAKPKAPRISQKRISQKRFVTILILIKTGTYTIGGAEHQVTFQWVS